MSLTKLLPVILLIDVYKRQQIYRRHNQINNILAYCACIAWIPCIIAAFGVDGIYMKILFAVLACCGAVCFFIFFFTRLPESLIYVYKRQPSVRTPVSLNGLFWLRCWSVRSCT